ncbi:hypothetical protein LXL04_030266 [Taraxacum kok-saghyz]
MRYVFFFFFFLIKKLFYSFKKLKKKINRGNLVIYKLLRKSWTKVTTFTFFWTNGQTVYAPRLGRGADVDAKHGRAHQPGRAWWAWSWWFGLPDNILPHPIDFKLVII